MKIEIKPGVVEVPSSDWTACTLELQVGALVLRVTSRNVPEAGLPDGRVVGMIEAAHESGTLGLLAGELVRGAQDALARYGAELDARARRPKA